MPECVVCGAVGLDSRSTECAQCGNVFGQQYNDSSSSDEEALQDNGRYERGGAGHNADSGRDQDIGRSSASESDESPVFIPYRDIEEGPEYSYTKTALAWVVLQQNSDKSNVTSQTGYIDVECPRVAGLTLREASRHNTALLRAEARHTSVFAKERGHPRITWKDSTLSSAVRTGWAQITVEQRTTTLGWLWCGQDHALLPVPLRTLRVAGLILWLDGSGQLCIPVHEDHDVPRLSRTQISDVFSGLVSSVSRHLSGRDEDEDDDDVNGGYADPQTTSSGSTGWVWDPNYQMYRIWSASENCWVRQDGTRLQPAHLQPTHKDQSQRHLTQHFRALRAS